MSYSNQITVWCDCEDCSEWVQYSTESKREASRLARREGWTVIRTKGSGGLKHLCPRCSKNQQTAGIAHDQHV